MLAMCLLNFIMAYTQPNQTNQQPPKPPSIEERMKKVNDMMAKETKLSADKKQQIEAAYKDFFGKMEELRKKSPMPPPPPPGKKEDVDKLVKERDDKIAKALTKDEFEKYKEIEKTLRPPAPPQDKDGKQPPPKNN